MLNSINTNLKMDINEIRREGKKTGMKDEWKGKREGGKMNERKEGRKERKKAEGRVKQTNKRKKTEGYLNIKSFFAIGDVSGFY